MGGERFAKGSKVSPNNFSCSVAWLERCIRIQLFLDRIVLAFTAKLSYEITRGHLLQCGKSSNSQYRRATSTIALILSITVHQYPSNRFRGRCCRTDLRERRAEGARKERERRTWPGQVIGQSGYYEKPNFAHAGREHHWVSSLACKFAEWV